MRSINTLLGTAVLGASIALFAPAAHAATALPMDTAACNKAVTAATAAQKDYDAAMADYKKQIAGGGHPGQAERDNLDSLKNMVNVSTSYVARVCTISPVGPVHTGIGSTSQGGGAADIALGAGLIAAVGAGAFALRRRQSGSQV